jgi:hypothetical protein
MIPWQTMLAQPANDSCDDAIVVAVNTSVAGTNAAAGTETVPACSGLSASDRTVWYQLTGNGDTITLSTCGSVNWDTQISVYTGDCSSLVSVACNDDDYGCGFYRASTVSFHSWFGETYYIRVGGKSGANGSFTLEITSPANFSECGMEDPDIGEVKQFLADLNVQQTSSSFENIYEIPVVYTVVKSEAGAMPNWAMTPALFVEHLNYVNDVFDNGMVFYLCEYRVIEDDLYYNIYPGTLQQFIDLADTYNVENAVNIYTVNTLTYSMGQVSGVGSFPWAPFNCLVINAQGQDLLAHELGHYFGLLHTHADGIRIAPDNSWNPYISEEFCSCCDCDDPEIQYCLDCDEDCDCNAFNSGDFIDDTPVDPGDNGDDGLCSPSLPSNDCMENSCTVYFNMGQNSLTYYPDRTNLMSYYGSCRDKFSPKQRERMKMVLLTHSNREDLLTPPSSCGDPGKGTVVAWKPDTPEPFPNAKVRIKSVQCIQVTDEDGVYSPFGCGNLNTFGNFTFGPLTDVPENFLFAHSHGVTTLDLIRIRRHILNIEELQYKPYSWIAADVNNSGTISTLDLIKIQKVILGVEEFTNVPSWRFLPEYALESEDFSDDFNDNPFTAVWTAPDGNRSYNGTNTYFDHLLLNSGDPVLINSTTWSFKGIKTGDVNFDAIISDDPPFTETDLHFDSQSHDCIQSGQYFSILVQASCADTISAYQLGIWLDTDKIELLSVNQGDVASFGLDDFNLEKTAGKLSTVWIDLNGGSIDASASSKALFKIHAKAKGQICRIDEYMGLSNSVLENRFYTPAGLPSEDPDLALEIVFDNIRHKVNQVYPNPAGSSLAIEMDLHETAAIDIVVTDQYNNSVSAQLSNQGPGVVTHTFNNISQLQNGMLNYQVLIGNELFSGMVIKL